METPSPQDRRASQRSSFWREAFLPTGSQLPRDLRVLVVFAHPDDAAIGFGSTVERLREVRFVCVTDGAPRDLQDAFQAGCSSRSAYVQLRRAELEAALSASGRSREDLQLLGIVDQEATLQLREIVGSVRMAIESMRPDIIVTQPYEGGHPDHDSTAFAVHMACRSRRVTGAVRTPIVEMTSYHSAAGAMRFGQFLPNAATEPLEIALDARARERKEALLACFSSQADLLASVPLDAERFRVAPDYDFSEPPHPGMLLYEQFPWGMTGANWRRHARVALSGGFASPLHEVAGVDVDS